MTTDPQKQRLFFSPLLERMVNYDEIAELALFGARTETHDGEFSSKRSEDSVPAGTLDEDREEMDRQRGSNPARKLGGFRPTLFLSGSGMIVPPTTPNKLVEETA